jgi:hypothetical protein
MSAAAHDRGTKDGANMKRMKYILAALLLAGLAGTVADAQSSDSLGDYARATRKNKTTTTKQFDNDNLPKDDKLSVVGQAPEPDADAGAKSDDKAASEGQAQDANAPKADAQSEAKSNDSAQKPASDADAERAAKEKMFEEWKNKISAQKEKIDLLSRELDVLQREYRLRAAAFYADAGNRIRNAGNWDQEDTKYKQQIDDKQKAVDAAKQQLDDMSEQARKAGVPAGMRE